MEEQTQPRIPSKEYIQNCKMKLQRNTRNQLLEKTDKYLLVDYPISDEQKEEVRVYRQLLRDYFSREDVINWVFTFENQQMPDFPPEPIFIV